MVNIGGIVIVVVSGLVQGLWTAPLKSVSPGWKFEHSWFFFSLTLGLMPVIMGFATVHDITEIINSVDVSRRVLVCILGICWGSGMVLFGLCASVVGHGLAFSLILGLSASLGSLIPLGIFHKEEVTEKPGIFDIIGVVVALMGIAMTGFSGIRREKLEGERRNSEMNQPLFRGDSAKMKVKCDSQKYREEVKVQIEERGQHPDGHDGRKLFPFWVGVILCIVAGLLSCCFSLAISYAEPFGAHAKDYYHVSSVKAANIQWILIISCGGAPLNFIYAVFLLLKNGTWRTFPNKSCGQVLWNVSLSILQGLLFWGGNQIYGVGLSKLGSLGPVFGFPITMGMNIVTANIFGALTGEWSSGDALATIVGVLGNIIIIASVVVIGAGSS